MKRDEIEVGGTYAGKSGKPRKVVSTGGVLLKWQEDKDTVNYVTPAFPKWPEKNCTRRSFASWARERIV